MSSTRELIEWCEKQIRQCIWQDLHKENFEDGVLYGANNQDAFSEIRAKLEAAEKTDNSLNNKQHMYEWRPIETAPKDGTRFLAIWEFWTPHPVICHHLKGGGGWYCSSKEESFKGIDPGPTLWMPLPEYDATEKAKP